MENKVKIRMTLKGGSFVLEIHQRVYDPDGIAPCLTSITRGGQVAKVVVGRSKDEKDDKGVPLQGEELCTDR